MERSGVSVVQSALAAARVGVLKICLGLSAVLVPMVPAEARQLAQNSRAFASPALPSATLAREKACDEPRVQLMPERGGRTRIAIDTACRAQQFVVLEYAGVVFIRLLDANGSDLFVLDCFAGEVETIAIKFEDNTKIVRQPVAADMRDVSKVAIVWSDGVDLDLHAFEYAAEFGGAGHVWSGEPGTQEEASARALRDGRGQGFISTSGAGSEIGMNFEVYTFMHRPGQTTGAVKLAVDYKTRGSRPTDKFCGTGTLAEVRFKAYVMERGRPARQLDLAFSAVPCGADLSARARFNSRLIPDLAIRG